MLSPSGQSSDSDDHYPRDFTVETPCQKVGWLLKKTKSIGKNRYSPIWVEIDELNQSVSCFSKESSLGALKSEKLLTFEIDNAKVTSGLSKRGKFLITIVDKNRKKYIFAAKSTDEQKSWVDSLRNALQSKNSKSCVLKKWIDDKETLDQIQFTVDTFKSLDDSPRPETASELSSNVTTANDISSESDQDVEEDNISVDAEKDLKRALYSMFLLDVEGNLTLFGDIVHGQTTLLFFLRHFGCILWRAAIEEVIEKRELLEKCGIRVAAIGNGTPEMAKEFLNDYPKFPGRLFVDPDKKVYNAMHCKFGVKCALSAEVLQGVRDACKKGYKQKGIQGDPLQLGGTFIISPTQGMIYRRLENYIGSNTDLPSLIPFITEYSRNHPQTTWQYSDVNTVSPQSSDYTFNFYQANFALQQHTIYVHPKNENLRASLILAVVDLKQGDYKCIAFHAKGKAKLYWPYYLSRAQMFEQMTQRIYGTPSIQEFIKVNRNPMIADKLSNLEETINSYLSTSENSDRLSDALEETTQLLVQHSISNNVGSPLIGSNSNNTLVGDS